MGKCYKVQILLLFSILFHGISSGSHISSGFINYECIGQNQYIISLTLFESCSTSFVSNNPQGVTLSDSCGSTSSLIYLPNVIYQQYSGGCDSSISTCGSGSLPGFFIHKWQDTVILSASCDYWTISYSSCCRATAVNANGQDSYYFQTVIRNMSSSCNSNVFIQDVQVPVICAATPTAYIPSFTDNDGDSLVFSLVPARATSNSVFITYSSGYSGTAPVPGISINSQTGVLSLNASITGTYIIAILAEEYNSAGELVGSTIFDFSLLAYSCGPSTYEPYLVGGISNFSGSATYSGDSLSGCAYDSFCFDLTFADSNSTDTISIFHQLQSLIPGASVAIAGYNPVTVTICGNMPGNDLVAHINFSDNSCPYNQVGNYSLHFNSIDSFTGGPDRTVCGSSVALLGSGASDYQWSVLSGDPITPANFSCDTCAQPLVLPSVTTTYLVQTFSGSFCSSSDTVTVFVIDPAIDSVLVSDPVICASEISTIEVFSSQPGSYSYSWSSSGNLFGSMNQADFSSAYSGDHEVQVIVSMSTGCVDTASVTITVVPGSYSNVSIVAPDSAMCNVPFNLSVFGAGNSTAGCAMHSSVCNTPSIVSVGTNDGMNGSTNWPAVFGNWYANGRHQFIFTASELIAAGVLPGLISGMDVEVLMMNGSLTTYPGYTIKLGCTSLTEFTNLNWIQGLVQVYDPKNLNVAAGNNSIPFDRSYSWDGNSSLVIEICYSWVAQYSYTYNASTPYTNTGVNRSLMYYSDAVVACSGPAPFGLSNMRPVISFHNCGVPVMITDGNFSWTPAALLDDPSSSNPQATISGPTTIYVSVTDTYCLNGTPSTFTYIDSIFVPISSDPLAAIQISDTILCPGEELIVDAGYSSGTITWTLNGASPASSTNLQDTFNIIMPGNYTLEFTGNNGCSSGSDSLEIIMQETYDTLMIMGLQNDTLCLGISGSFYSVTDLPSSANSWLFNGSPVGNSDTISVVFNTPGLNQIEVSSGNDCQMLSDFYEVLIYDRNIYISDSVFCIQDSLYTDAGFLLPGSYITWALSSGIPVSSGNPEESFLLNSPGTNWLSYSGYDGCETFSDSLLLTILEYPDSLEIVSDYGDTACTGQTFPFYFLSDDNADISWWLNGGYVANVDSITVSFASNVNHTIVASLNNTCGGITDSLTIYVSECLSTNDQEAEPSLVSLIQNVEDLSARLSITCSAPQTIEMMLFNISGQLIENYSYSCIGGNNEIKLDMGGVSRGIYLLQVYSGNEKYIFKILR